MNKLQFLNAPEKDRLGRVLRGTAFYSSLHTPNMSGVAKFNSDPYFIVNLGLTPEEAAKAESYGLKVLPPVGEINMPHVKIKRKAPAGEDITIEVVDTNGNDIPKNVLVGNGSEVICKFATYWYDAGGGGIGAALYKVQVLKLVPFVRKDKDFINDGSGYVVPQANDSSTEDEFEGDDLPWEKADNA